MILVALALVAATCVVTLLAVGWRPTWPDRNREPCEVCHCRPRHPHIVTSAVGGGPEMRQAIGSGIGGGAISATFCAVHCPGGCLRGD